MDILSRSGDIRDQSLKWSKIDRNLACFWPPNFFGGPPPEFLKSIYKIQSDSDHAAKFQGDRSRHLGEPVAKQKKTSGAKYKPVRNGCSGRPNNLHIIFKVPSFQFLSGKLRTTDMLPSPGSLNVCMRILSCCETLPVLDAS